MYRMRADEREYEHERHSQHDDEPVARAERISLKAQMPIAIRRQKKRTKRGDEDADNCADCVINSGDMVSLQTRGASRTKLPTDYSVHEKRKPKGGTVFGTLFPTHRGRSMFTSVKSDLTEGLQHAIFARTEGQGSAHSGSEQVS